MQVTDLQIEHHGDQSWTLSASVDNARVYFRYHGVDEPANLVGDAFLVAALIPAMKRHESLYVDKSVPVSQHLLANLMQYQEIYRHWYPALENIHVEAKTSVDNEGAGQQSGCFFSGGVDSIYTVSQTVDQLDYLLLCCGLDIPINENRRWEKTRQLAEKFADDVGLELITVTTNVKEQLRCRDIDNHGAILVSNGIGLGFKRLYVPASHAWDELTPWGSHPVTDPLLGNGKTSVIHHGNVFRTEKTAKIIEFGYGVDDLRVCNVHSEYNCGKCEKCLRTMICLKMLSKSVASLPALPNSDVIASLRLDREGQYFMWQDIYRLASRTNNSDVQSAVGKLLKRYEKREHLKESDRLFFNQTMLRLKRNFMKGNNYQKH